MTVLPPPKAASPIPKAFRGVLDESLDTLKLAEVYDRHKSEFDYPYLDGKKRFCQAVVCLSFNRAIKLYESYGNRYVLNGYSVTDADMQDHVCISTVGGKLCFFIANRKMIRKIFDL